jgi:hypothetical protein
MYSMYTSVDWLGTVECLPMYTLKVE